MNRGIYFKNKSQIRKKIISISISVGFAPLWQGWKGWRHLFFAHLINFWQFFLFFAPYDTRFCPLYHLFLKYLKLQVWQLPYMPYWCFRPCNARLYEGWSGSGCYCGGAAPRDSRLHDGVAPLLGPRWDTSKGRKYPRTSATFIFLGRDPEHGGTVSCSNCCYLFIVIGSCSTSNIKCWAHWAHVQPPT